MATASPTPVGQGSHFTSLGRRTSARQALRRPTSRPGLARSESNPGPASAAAVLPADAKSHSQQYATLNDSSDDEIPVPMKLSALTKAILNDGAGSEASSAAPSAVARQSSPPVRVTRHRSVLATSTSSAGDEGGREKDGVRERQTRRHVRAGSAQIPASSRHSSPVRSRENSPAPRKRVVRLSTATTPGMGIVGGGVQNPLRRSLSSSTQRKQQRPPSRDKTDERNQAQVQAQSHPRDQAQPLQPNREAQSDLSTPAAPIRTVRIAVGSSGNRVRSAGSSGMSSKQSGGAQSDQELPEDPGTAARSQAVIGQGSVTRYGTVGKKDDVALQSSMRIKRVSKVPGSFLSGPARRGRRRQSEEDAEENEGEPLGSSQERESQQPENDGQDPADQPASYFAPSFRDFAASGSPVSAKDSARASRRQSPNVNGDKNAGLDLADFRISIPPPLLPSGRDKENQIPISFKKSILGERPLNEKDLVKAPVRPLNADMDAVNHPIAGSPERKALAMKNHNTPHRPAPPPPPKMSVVETATKPAGAATTAQGSKKKAMLLKVNGAPYTRIDCIGRGGSSKVYRVAAENGKMYALKRVSIENADENTVKGYKGEIDLLKKLSGVDRVIGLVDYELNEEKQMLSLVMEQGELDLNKLLQTRYNHEGSKLDPVFVRFYWKEMLECVSAVHTHDIVHSDLKPANFVLVQGRLKLIDFGIANAIQTEETVNVHRETQVGTPNYMSPESLMDTNQYAFTSANNGRFCIPPGLSKAAPKLMKLGKASDVWSLGCILYQMVYGTPPFGHIPNQMSRCQAIINWSHAIDFPERGVGGVPVPPSLVRTIRRCLNREQALRPTCDELLAPTDPFLYPIEFDPDVLGERGEKALPMTEEILGRIISSVVQRCRERLPTDGEYIGAWPGAYFSSVRKAVEARQAKT